MASREKWHFKTREEKKTNGKEKTTNFPFLRKEHKFFLEVIKMVYGYHIYVY